MRLKPEQLPDHLRKRGLPAVCLIGGDEPLQRREAVDAIRLWARAQGIEERLSFDTAVGIDWSEFRQQNDALSLFAARRLFEVNIHNGKIGADGSAVIADLTARTAGDDAVVLISDKLDRTIQGSKWFKAVEQTGFVMLVLPLPPARIPDWIQSRLRGEGRRIAPEAAAFIAERVEGNLLAAAQEIEKLLLLVDGPDISLEAATAAVVDSARYDMYAMVDEALAGKAARALRMVRGLRAEGFEPILLSWLLNRETRSLAAMRAELGGGRALADVLEARQVWSTRRNVITSALRRHSVAGLQSLLRASARIDAINKGVDIGDPWDEIEWAVLRLARPEAPAVAVEGA
jgi:DNA polymerase-3 subunit delta